MEDAKNDVPAIVCRPAVFSLRHVIMAKRVLRVIFESNRVYRTEPNDNREEVRHI